jgi:hypothetical protein
LIVATTVDACGSLGLVRPPRLAQPGAGLSLLPPILL